MMVTIVYWCLISHMFAHGWEVVVTHDPKHPSTCLMGYMTDAQKWVTTEGQLTNNTTPPYSSIDLSEVRTSDHDIVDVVRRRISSTKAVHGIKSFSFAKCGLSRVPWVFHLKDSSGWSLSATLEYITFYGNSFMNRSNSQNYGWASGFSRNEFYKLRELDLRKCSIQVLEDNYFQNMGKLEALYLGENSITQITDRAFHGLRSLLHLDLSRNSDYRTENTLVLDTKVFSGLSELVSLDFSFSKLDRRSCISALENLSRKVRRLSLCYTAVSRLQAGIFQNTSIAYLDVSGNPGMLEGPDPILGLENQLKVLYADSSDLRSLEIFQNFQYIEVLRLRNNEIVSIPPMVVAALEHLQVLDLDNNRLATWLNPVINKAQNLKLFSIKDNNLNLISQDMMKDFSNLEYLALAGNSLVCNCNCRELFEIAYRNENTKTIEYLKPLSYQRDDPYAYTGFDFYNNLLKNRRKVVKDCDKKNPLCNPNADSIESEGKYLLIDYDTEAHKCLSAEGNMSTYLGLATCIHVPRLEDIAGILHKGWERLWALLVIPIIVFPTLIFLFVFRKNLRYFCVMVKNTATLSLINNNEVIDDDTIFNYDVFVSYCNEDREWVLDYLLPHLEQDYNVSVCLHERDFQVGLSILENIVSCMDRSRSILLVLSRRFLLSQWCQFEMHLAQHRLLETRREDLILLLLEEIPRGIRPTTLHYLMLTKTYIVWPERDTEREQFWRRLKRSLIARRLIHGENVSLA